MNDKHDLHLSRLRESLKSINDFVERNLNARNSDFRSWRERVKQSLGELFGKEHDYTRRFSSLQFCEARMRVRMTRSSRQDWSHQDQETFENDLKRANVILSDALEEFPVLPPKAEAVSASSTLRQPPIVVNINNWLTQTTKVELSQVMANLDALELPPVQLAQAKAHAEELAKEVQGEQRWPVLAKSLEALKSMGKSVYDNVALPLLLEVLKRQTGLDN